MLSRPEITATATDKTSAAIAEFGSNLLVYLARNSMRTEFSKSKWW